MAIVCDLQMLEGLGLRGLGCRVQDLSVLQGPGSLGLGGKGFDLNSSNPQPQSPQHL